LRYAWCRTKRRTRRKPTRAIPARTGRSLNAAAPAFGRLARTFPTQIEALNRYRNHSEPAITVQNVRVGDGGNAIVGNVTQHASVIVPDSSGAAAVTDARMRAMPDRGARVHDSLDARRKAQA
jgi:hypothetical protein